MMRPFGLACAVAALTHISPTEANAACRQALALGLDVSASVDAQEYRLQLDGLAAALGSAEVSAILLADGSAPVRVAIYEWSAPGSERLILGWTDITDLAALRSVQARLNTTQRADIGSSTGLGSALEFGVSLLQTQDHCWTQTLDLSGDGKGNIGRHPQNVDAPPHIRVNGLVVGVDDGTGGHERDLQIGELAAYYNAFVIRGIDAFVETALGFEDYETAMRRKLIRELSALTVSQAQPQ